MYFQIALLYCIIQYGFSQNSGRILRVNDNSQLIITQFTTDHGGWNSFDTRPRYIGDYDGDGIDDIIAFGDNGVQVAYGDPLNMFSTIETVSNDFGNSSPSFSYSSQNLYPRFVGDINNDTMVDIIGCEDDGIYVSLSQGKGNMASTRTKFSSKFGINDGYTTYDVFPRMIYDIDGDGFADIIGFSSTEVDVMYSNGTQFVTRAGSNLVGDFIPSVNYTVQNIHPRFIGDVNGDGYGDIVGIDNDSIQCALSNNGVGFNATFTMVNNSLTPNGTWINMRNYPRSLLDYSGDGKADLIGHASQGVLYFEQQAGYDFSNILAISNYDFCRNYGYPDQENTPLWLGDFNNDTLIDIIGFKDDGVYIGYGMYTCSHSTRNLSTSCACIAGTFDNGDGLACPTCIYPCQTCQNSGNNCSSCANTPYRVSQTDCRCQEGYYDNGTECDECDYRVCVTCSTNKQTCIQPCDILCGECNLDGTCKSCNIGYYLQGSNCLQCHPKCISCVNQPDNCIICQQGIGRQQEQQCDCLEGFYEVPNQLNCVQCSNQFCETCDSSGQCLQCTDRNLFPPSCLKQPNPLNKSSFIKQYNNIPIIIQCHTKCDKCIGEQNNCLECKKGLNRNQQLLCNCRTGYHDHDGSSTDCFKCHNTCDSCISESNCESCKEGLYRSLNQSSKKCECMKGYRENQYNNTCIKCFYFQNKCVFICPQNTLQKDDKCLDLDIQKEQNILYIAVGFIFLLVSFVIMIMCLFIRNIYIQKNKQNTQKFKSNKLDIIK